MVIGVLKKLERTSNTGTPLHYRTLLISTPGAKLGAYVGDVVRVKYDPADLGRIYVFSAETQDFICRAECHERTGIDLIDSYVGLRYDLPLATVPERLKRLSAAIARFYLHKDAPPEAVRQAYDDGIKFLKDVAAGRAVLDVAGAEPAAAPASVQTSGPARVFDKTSLDGY